MGREDRPSRQNQYRTSSNGDERRASSSVPTSPANASDVPNNSDGEVRSISTNDNISSSPAGAVTAVTSSTAARNDSSPTPPATSRQGESRPWSSLSPQPRKTRLSLSSSSSSATRLTSSTSLSPRKTRRSASTRSSSSKPGAVAVAGDETRLNSSVSLSSSSSSSLSPRKSRRSSSSSTSKSPRKSKLSLKSLTPAAEAPATDEEGTAPVAVTALADKEVAEIENATTTTNDTLNDGKPDEGTMYQTNNKNDGQRHQQPTHRDLRLRRLQEQLEGESSGESESDDDDGDGSEDRRRNDTPTVPGAVAVVPANSISAAAAAAAVAASGNNNGRSQDKPELPFYVSSDEFSLDQSTDNDIHRKSGEFDMKDGGKNQQAEGGNGDHGHLPRANIVVSTPVDEIPIDEEEAIRKEAEAAMLSKIVPAEEIDKDEMDRNVERRRTIRVGIAALIVAVLVGVVVGVILATTNSDDSGSSTTANGEDPTTQIDLGNPLGFTNITNTAVQCRDAIPIVLPSDAIGSNNPIIITGSTFEATFDDQDPDGPFQPCDGEDIGDVTANGAGVWYSLTGTGIPLALSTCFGCSFDTQISVYRTDSSSGSTGSIGCSSSMSCVASNDQRTNCGTDGSHFTFLAETNEEYLIYIHGRRRSEGVFTLIVTAVEGNDECISATEIEDSDPTGQVAFFGTTKFSTADLNIEECNGVSINSPGAWFVFQAKTSRFLQARVDDFLAHVTVFTGSSCDDLSCVAGNGEGRAMWTAQEGSFYYIFVHGDGMQQSDFSLTILPGGLLRLPPGTNDRCDISEEILAPDQPGEIVLVEGSTSSDATNWNFTIPGCGSFVSSNTMGRWFSVVGKGQGLVASTCETESGFLGQVVVYAGTCDFLQCLDGGDGNCGDQGAVAWYAEADVVYNILVIGVDDRVGDFVLALETVDAQISNKCENSSLLPLGSTSVLGSTQGAMNSSTGSCQGLESSSPSSYYFVYGTGGPMMASTCDSQISSNAKIEVFQGSECTAKKCLEAISRHPCGDQMAVTWQSLVDETYLVQVYKSGSTALEDESLFKLDVKGIPENYRCIGASDELRIGSTISASTDLFSLSDGICSNPDEEGTWYKVRFTNAEAITLSACSSRTSVDVKISVFSGGDCDQLTCLASNNGRSCGPRSFVTLNASFDQDYYILVQAMDVRGNFELSLGVENDICDAAKSMLVGQSESGTTVGSTVDQGKFLMCDTAMVEGMGVWFSVFGVGSLLRVSTCSGLSSTATRISVYGGPSCENLSCIDHVDENIGCEDEMKSGAIWFAESGKVYYILVHSPNPTDFVLDVEEVTNDSCLSSLPVALTGGPSKVVIGQTLSSGTSFFDPCIGVTRRGQNDTWYEFEGTGGLVTIDACDENFGPFDSLFISVFTKGCADLLCNTFVQADCSLTVDTVFGEHYVVAVGSTSTSLNNQISMEFSATNDSCETAFGPLIVGDDVFGSNIGATSDGTNVGPQGESLCGPVRDRGAGVWYSYVGTGDLITVFTCSEFTDFDTQITVYRGGSCGLLFCVDSRDDNCGRASWLTFEGEVDIMYYILVTGKGDSEGQFVLSIQ